MLLSMPALAQSGSISSSLGAAGDPGGVRTALEAKGITYGLGYTGEALYVARGGLKRGTVYEGELDLRVDVDLGKLAGLSGLTAHMQGYQIHGTGPTHHLLGNLMTGSNIEARPSTRLGELWLEQTLLDGKLAVRAGQIAGDSDFIVSDTAALFINGTFGWPAGISDNVPAGGVSYPWAAPGIRVKVTPAPGFTVAAAAFNGDPTGGERQHRNPHGLRFPIHNAPFFIGELSYAYNTDENASGLPGAIKVGGWYDSGRFDDQRYGNDGVKLADPAGTGIARRHRGNTGIYAVADQTLWRMPGTTDQGIAAFARLTASPGDRNLIGFYADGGITFKGVVPGRPDDTPGIAFAYAGLSRQARASDRDARAFGAIAPLRTGEMLIEITYQAQLIAGWTIQPNLQYVRHPSDYFVRPHAPAGHALRDAVMVGLRTTLRY